MTVKVYDVLNRVLFMASLKVFLDAESFRGQLFCGVSPLPIQVYSGQVAPGVPVDDPVWVNHWDDHEAELGPR